MKNGSETYQLGYHDGEMKERKEWLDHLRCENCGEIKEGNLSSMCTKCYEEA